MITGRCVIYMAGSFIASQIDNDFKREKYYKEKAQREKCKEKKCSECKYHDICENVEDINIKK